jgi:hypothetical protein
MEAQQLAVVQPAGCCVSIEDGSTRCRECVLACPPERFTLRAQLLTAQRVWSGRGHVYAAANITELHRAGQAALLLEPATRLLARDNVLHPLPAENEGAIASARTRDHRCTAPHELVHSSRTACHAPCANGSYLFCDLAGFGRPWRHRQRDRRLEQRVRVVRLCALSDFDAA